MGVLEALKNNNIPVTPDIEQRVKLLVEGLRGNPEYEAHLKEYASSESQMGGAEDDTIPIPVKMTKGDFLGSEARWFVEVMGSPYSQVVVRLLFTVLFFVSYLETIPGIGNILSAALDIMLAGGRMVVKAIQKFLPPAMGVLPLPYASMVGLIMASAFGLIVWPLLAILSFSRQDFTSAIDSFVRVIPPPMGDALADAFLDANRTAYKLNENRKKLTEDIVSGLQLITDVGKKVGPQVAEGAEKLQTTLQSLPTPTTGARRHRLSRKKRTQTKWKTSRQRIKSVKRSGSGLR